MIIDVKSYEHSVKLFQSVISNHEIDNELIKAYYDTDGIQFLNRHLMYYGGWSISENVFSRLIRETCKTRNKSNIFEESIIKGIELLRRETCIDLDHVIESIQSGFALANQFLPVKIKKEDLICYLLFGFRGTSIVLRNEMALDLCDEYLYNNGIMNYSKICNLIAHEIHHIGFDQMFKESVNQLAYGVFYNQLLSEGLAVAFFTHDNKEITEKAKVMNVTELIENTNRLISARQNNLELVFFDESLKGYILGIDIINEVRRSIGTVKLIEAIKNPIEILQVYNQLRADRKLNQLLIK